MTNKQQFYVPIEIDGTFRPLKGVWNVDEDGLEQAHEFLEKEENRNLSVVKVTISEVEK